MPLKVVVREGGSRGVKYQLSKKGIKERGKVVIKQHEKKSSDKDKKKTHFPARKQRWESLQLHNRGK